MIKFIIHSSLRFRGLVVFLATILLFYGFYVAAHSKLDVFPDFVPPQVVVQTEAPGLAAEDVEMLVTRPLEIAFNGLGGQEALRSESIQGLSVITVVFEEGSDVVLARQRIAERLAEMTGMLPVGVKSPKLSPLTSSTMDLLKIGLVSTHISPLELRTFADWTLKPRLLSVKGVAKCSSFGGEVEQFQIQVQPEKLRAYNLGINDVMAAARLSSGIRGGGYIDTPNQRIVLEPAGQSTTPEMLGKSLLAVSSNNIPIRLADVAAVVEGSEPKFGDALINGVPGVLLTLSSQAGANTMQVTLDLERALEEFKPLFAQKGITLFPRLHRPATFIEHSIHNVTHSLLIGAILVAVVLTLFLGHWRSAFVSLTAIPLSLLSAIIILDRLGITLNTITLGGLAIAIGEVVDDAIIDVENIFRRLRENQALANPLPVMRVVLEASMEVRTAVVYATFIVALVFVPVMTLTGLQGKFFSPLAISYVLAIMASLLVALTVTPALSFLLLARPGRSVAETGLQRFLKRQYIRFLRGTAPFFWISFGVALALCILAIVLAPRLKSEFLPEFREGHFVLQISTAPGTSISEMLRIGATLSHEFLSLPRIATVEEQIGRSELGEDTWGPNRAEFHVELKRSNAEEQAQTEEGIRRILKEMPGIQYEVTTFLGDRIGESISGETAPVVVNLFGEDLDLLDEKGSEIAAALKSVNGAGEVQEKAPGGAPVLNINLRPDRVAALGFSPVEVLDAIQSAYQGSAVTQVYRQNQIIDVVVILDPVARNEIDEVGSYLLRNASGALWPLRELATLSRGNGRSAILHEGGRRRQTITCSPENEDIGEFVERAEKRIREKVPLPEGYYLEFSGSSEQEKAATRELAIHSALAGVGIVIFLRMVLRTWTNTMIVLFNLPFALIGGVFSLFVARFFGVEIGLSMGALVGFVTLFGITTRNSIMLVSHFQHLVIMENARWNFETMLRGASERLIPILITAIVTGLGLLPLALGSGEAGRELEGPMAVVILGGLITSTVLNLVILPAAAYRFMKLGRD
jgi:CzcA family heavy metal efflux pump